MYIYYFIFKGTSLFVLFLLGKTHNITRNVMYYILSKQYYYIKVMKPRHIYLLTLVLDKLVKSTTYVCITRMH